jgi:hypothetical protein
VADKLESESRWKTPRGFDKLMKRDNIHEHPHKPHEAVLDSLKYSYAKNLTEVKAAEKARMFNPEDYGKKDF